MSTDMGTEVTPDSNTDINPGSADDATPAASARPSGGRHRAAKSGKAKQPKASVVDLTDTPAASTLDPKKVDLEKRVEGASGQRSRKGVIALVMAIVVTAAAVVTAFTLHQRTAHIDDLKAVQHDAAEALAQAKHDVQDILSYDYRHLDDDINLATGETTGQLRADYTSTAKKVLASAPSIKAVSKAVVSDKSAGVVHAERGRVTVLLYVDQETIKTLKGQKSPTTRIDPVRVQMTMTKVGKRWLASDLKPI